VEVWVIGGWGFRWMYPKKPTGVFWVRTGRTRVSEPCFIITCLFVCVSLCFLPGFGEQIYTFITCRVAQLLAVDKILIHKFLIEVTALRMHYKVD